MKIEIDSDEVVAVLNYVSDNIDKGLYHCPGFACADMQSIIRFINGYSNANIVKNEKGKFTCKAKELIS